MSGINLRVYPHRARVATFCLRRAGIKIVSNHARSFRRQSSDHHDLGATGAAHKVPPLYTKLEAYLEGIITFGPRGDQVIKGDFHQSKFLILVANFLQVVHKWYRMGAVHINNWVTV